jgi:nucleotide-binding universal stress UspA family protein
MKNILVPVEEHSLIHSVLETALVLGRIFDSYIEGAPVSINLPIALPVDIAIGVPSVLDPATRNEMADTSRKHFESFMTAKGVHRVGAGAGIGYGWHDGELMDDTFLGSYGRVFDITVVGRPGSAANHPRLSTAEAALFESGRPILIVPPTPPTTIGETIVIAWNGSTETARTVAQATPFLARARRIIVLSIEDWGTGPTGEDLARALRRRGLAVETTTVPNPTGRHGETILNSAAGFGCDLLVKGAYTQSRLRQMILGGATSHILAHAGIPVFMAH